MTPTRTLSPAAAFFFEHAGYSYNTKTETPEEGRTRCAESLAAAEEAYTDAHAWADVTCDWEDDNNPEDSESETVECARMSDGNGDTLACLCGIEDADANYRRVVRAELASECLDQLRALFIEATGGIESGAE